MTAEARVSVSLALWISVSPNHKDHALAYEFVQLWMERGHDLALVFLHAAAVDAATSACWSARWMDIATDRVFVCSAACERRSLEPIAMPQAGLALWLARQAAADRRVYFRER